MPEFTDSVHSLTAFVVPLYLVLLQIKNGINDQTQAPFSTIHPTVMSVAFSILFYFVVHVTLLLFPALRSTAAARLFSLSSAFAAVAAAAAPLLPAWVSTTLCVFLGLISTGGLICTLGHDYKGEGEGEGEDEDEEGQTWIVKVYRKHFRRFCGRVAGIFGQQPQPVLPIRN